MKKVGLGIIGALCGLLLIVISIGGAGKSVETHRSSKSDDATNSSSTSYSTVKEISSAESGVVVEQNTPTPTLVPTPTPTSAPIIVDNPSVEVDNTPVDIVVDEVTKVGEIDLNILDFKNEIKEVEVYVASKKAYTEGSQLFYVVSMKPKNEDLGLDVFNYVVSYGTYNSILLGDSFIVEYEILKSNIYSILRIKNL